MHDHRPQNQHDYRNPAVNGKSQGSFPEHLRHILHGFQIQDPVQCIHGHPGLDIIPVFPAYHPVCPGIFIRLLQNPPFGIKTAADIQHIFMLVGNPEHTAGIMSACFQVGGYLLHRMILKHIVFSRHIQGRCFKSKTQDAAFIQSLLYLPVQGGFKYIIHKIKPAESERQRHYNHRTQQQL